MAATFGKFWDHTYHATAKKYLDKWFWWAATHSRLEPMIKFAWMIRRHQDDILDCFKLLGDMVIDLPKLLSRPFIMEWESFQNQN